MPPEAPRRPQERVEVLLGIYIHGHPLPSSWALLRGFLKLEDDEALRCFQSKNRAVSRNHSLFFTQ